MPPGWQFLADILPVQLASERLARLRGEDPDNFRFCSFVVEAEDGLGGARTARVGQGTVAVNDLARSTSTGRRC